MTQQIRSESSLMNGRVHQTTDPAINTSGRRRKRRWFFRLTALLLAVGFIPLLEGIMRLLDLGPSVSLTIPVSPTLQAENAQYTHQINGTADLPYFGQTDIAGPEVRPFTLPKPENVYRIIVLGGSTVIGFPYAPELAFPRQLQIQLQRQDPDVTFEVLNAGITSLNSFAVQDLVTQCQQADPDLIIVHTGHNEFYGPGGPASSAFQLSPKVIRLTYRLRRWRSIQMLSSLTAAPGQLNGDLMDILPAQLSIPLDGDVYRQARLNYESNLRHMVEHCEHLQIPLLLTTVECNLRDQSPLLAIWPRASNDGQEEWNSLMEQALQQISDGQFESALTTLDQASRITPEHADISFRRGQCFDGLGLVSEAWEAFSHARDLDGCRFRIPSEFHDIPLQLARGRKYCQSLNLMEEIRRAGYDAAPGFNLFLEHVHYNFEGHHLVATLIARSVQTTIRSQPWDDSQTADVSAMKQLAGFLPEDDLAATSFAMQVLQTGPFSRSIDRSSHLAHLAERAEHIFQSLPGDRGSVFAELSMNQLASDLPQHLLHAHQQRGDHETVNQLKQALKLRTPWRTE